MAEIEQISDDVNDFWAPRSIKILDNPSPLEFLRDCVSSYEPCIIRNAINHWPILNMTVDELFAIYEVKDKTMEKHIRVNITPDGYGDAVKEINNEKSFVYPAESSD